MEDFLGKGVMKQNDKLNKFLLDDFNELNIYSKCNKR